MSQVQILKINVLFAQIKNLIKNQGFDLFQIVFLCKQFYQRNLYILFSFEH